jgi:hypothetical protein
VGKFVASHGSSRAGLVSTFTIGAADAKFNELPTETRVGYAANAVSQDLRGLSGDEQHVLLDNGVLTCRVGKILVAHS